MTDQLEFLAAHSQRVNQALTLMLDDKKSVTAARLWEAMHYSLSAGGKRIRPALMLECFEACGGKSQGQHIMPAALSIECMHTYSLIHDDLPCMDDDDLRRGMPTCHKKFDETTAVLAADALQALSFELLTELDASDAKKLALVNKLAIAGGAPGMVGGQMLDMLASAHTTTDIVQVERIHLKKTGALLHYCCEAGAILATDDESKIAACSRYGKAIGLLFQVADDILDATATDAQLGKSAGKDAAQHKATYVSVLGLSRARELGQEMLDTALEGIDPLGNAGSNLRQLADYILRRDT